MAKNFIIPEELFAEGKSSFVQKPQRNDDYTPVRYLKKDEWMTVRFVTAPWEAKESGDHSWFAFRQVNAFQGFRNGFKQPSYLNTFWAHDQEVVVDENGNLKRAWTRDHLADAVKPSKEWPVRNSEGEILDVASISRAGAINIIDENDIHAILIVGTMAYEAIVRDLTAFKKANKSFDHKEHMFALKLTGKGLKTTVVVELADDDYYPIEWPEPISCVDFLQERRNELQRLYDEYCGIDTGDDEEDEAESDEIVDAFENIISGQDVEDVAMSETDYSDLSPARLRKMLRNADIKVAPGTKDEEVLELAIRHKV